MASTEKRKEQPAATVQNFPIVGIGASAGGLDAFKRLLKAIPVNSGMAYVLVQHLDPSHDSILPEILQRVTTIPVHEITEDIHLAPDHIYIIPENKILTSSDGVLQLNPRDKKIVNFTIDIFFTSLAEVHKEFAVGVILSGKGKDGTQGLKKIKEHGGICIAQSLDSASYVSMPQSAVNAGVVDFVLSPEEIPRQLLKIIKTFKSSALFNEEVIPKDDEEVFKQILELLHKRSGVDFTFYKRPTLQRRIARRIAMGNKNNISEYLSFISANVAEQDALFQDVLIPVTSFFRDTKTFKQLSDTIFPHLFKNRSTDEPFRIWIAGCSTGEEAYSIAITLYEFLGAQLQNTKIQIFASDISEKAINKARTAIYTKSDIEPFSAVQLSKYFTKNNEGYQLCKFIRDMCVIASHNILKDPPFAKMDLISCRNVLIYMDPFLQKKALTTFHYALKENGFLVLGKSESTGASSDLFTQLSKNEKIYMRKEVASRFRHVTGETKQNTLTTKPLVVSKHKNMQTDFQKSAEAVMIAKSPASVVVNEQLDIVHIHGNITPFLQVPEGKPTHNLLRMAREGLGFELRNAVHKSAKEKMAVLAEGIPIKSSSFFTDKDKASHERESESLVTIEVIPLTNTVEKHYLVRFELIHVTDLTEDKASDAKQRIRNEAEKRNQQLEKELAHNREDMRSITQDMEASNEELQGSNEELQSSNEEMQSLNEELETSKEELQSTNEELIIVNQELLEKQDQLNAARYYAESIVSTIREPLVILDRSLSIKTANTSFYKKFNVDELETEGKLFYEIQNNQWDDELMRSLLEKILPKKERLTDFEITLHFPSIGERTLLLNALQIVNEKNSEKLILLAIEDITERRLVEHKLQTFSEDLENQVIERTAALKKSNEDLRQTNVQLDQFAHVASHDLQEPLRKISIFSKRLQSVHKADMSKDVQTYIDKIEGAAGRMSLLIQDLLNYSRLLQHEKIFVPVDLNKTVHTALIDFEVLLQDKMGVVNSDELPLIKAIPLQMNQLFYNLISNALKFSRVDVPSVITITSHELSQEKVQHYSALNENIRYVEIIFKDNGIGFNQHYAKQIFTIFQRLHGNEKYLGTGIGLALCRKIVENHHGIIFANAKENEGAAFHIILPLKQ